MGVAILDFQSNTLYSISNLIDLNPEKALSAFKQQVSFLKNPPKNESEVLDMLKKSGLATTSSKLQDLMEQEGATD